MNATTVIVVMGVSGSGKSSVGEALAERLGVAFQDGDDFHPAANVAKMRAGTPLDDADRAPWLDRTAAWIADRLRERAGGVIACSALKRAYRDRLRRAGSGVRFVHLHVPRAELERRMTHREHFMPASLLDSQLATLEVPVNESDAAVVEGDDVQATVAAVRSALRGLEPARPD